MSDAEILCQARQTLLRNCGRPFEAAGFPKIAARAVGLEEGIDHLLGMFLDSWPCSCFDPQAAEVREALTAVAGVRGWVRAVLGVPATDGPLRDALQGVVRARLRQLPKEFAKDGVVEDHLTELLVLYAEIQERGWQERFPQLVCCGDVALQGWLSLDWETVPAEVYLVH